ncbi:hypothetical protein AAFA46_02360 [Oscillospiraceae bacterium WX1]
MYNRYIGNTGKYVRVQDAPTIQNARRGAQGAGAALPAPPSPAHGDAGIKNKPINAGAAGNGLGSLFGGLGSGLGSLLGGRGGLNNLFGGFGNGLKGAFDNLPFGLDIGDLLLFLLLLFFFIESGDEEFLIILAFLAFSIINED